MDREAKLKRIYEAAIKIFSVYGYKKTTIEGYRVRAWLDKGRLYKYVEGKEDLYSKSVCYLLKIWQQKAIDAANNTQKIFCASLRLCVRWRSGSWLATKG